MKQLLIATKNANKLSEIKTLLGNDVQVESLLDYPNFAEIAETGTTFAENARLKAQSAIDFLQIPTLADDSGLSVDYLHGQPGVRSARYAGDHDDAANNAKLLAELGGVPLEKRTAHFSTTMVYLDPLKDQEIVVTGKLEGLISLVPQGHDGFGYDSLFYVPTLHKTLAELSLADKNKISHRGSALRQFVEEYNK
ncbi:RdgB/HAM1 family non-canonical purine NTP pyrophosphatase [Bombilactobacillus thymidiniphilus]|uniref:dITP/XTP pyrophosphatase n=1 Tax=Bombilactobacillus thymidiniphilus TaxID=2923363 RepID=A0ABY4PEB5_9LACO|nr:RdgB/HAM1 family non-canonical purine NTP pyrophosphatase [Bombilactobacillus thymidiniphilus]UQS83887.1 RdgB/HAM1 family non-canonical purine NTP pyrophosphatase [Bombilactobacillus thymidiniphilus]